MKYILIAVYLAHGSIKPTIDSSELITKEECKERQQQWMKQQNRGFKWSLCQSHKKEKP